VHFERPVDRRAYRALVYAVVRAIPSGRVMTYGSVAALIPPPQGTDWASYQRIRARWVGYAMSNCPKDVPWHRVVNAQGRISGRHGLGPELQHELLSQEGVSFDRSGKLDLEALHWEPQNEWLLQHGLGQPQR
jgi:methylated-DNA-protein-cysteine methyltransferase-like protein